jgi:ParB family chromosome partitioning protein
MAKIALGKGLNALINTRVASPTPVPESGERVQQISLSEIVPTPLQPRTEFQAERLNELIDSIRTKGIIQPLIVRKVAGKFELIAGERRWRAAKEVGLTEAPVIIRSATDQEVLELALIENIQRADLNPMEEAAAYQRLAKEFGLKQEEIAAKVGKSRAAVANCMRLLELHPQIQTWITQQRISVGHAKVLLAIKAQDEQLFLAETILRQGCTVRAAEKLIAHHLTQQGKTRQSRPGGGGEAKNGTGLTPAFANVENRLRQHLATHVALHHQDKKGRIEIEYYGSDDLQRILGIFGLPQEEI